MTPKEITIMLSEIAGEVDGELADIASPCKNTDAGQIVERVAGRLYIVDGFHRSAGQIAHCREHGLDVTTHSITVVLACVDESDNQLVADAAEPGARQDAAIAEIYRLAGRN